MVDKLRQVAKSLKDEEQSAYLHLAATDPLNFFRILLAETKLAKLASNRVLYQNGLPIAVLETKKVKFLRQIEADQQWHLQQALIRRH